MPKRFKLDAKLNYYLEILFYSVGTGRNSAEFAQNRQQNHISTAVLDFFKFKINFIIKVTIK